MNALPPHVEEKISGHLAEIQACFKHARITLVVRTVDVAENGDVLMGDDEPQKAVDIIKRFHSNVV
jgi:hypothetical protein